MAMQYTRRLLGTLTVALAFGAAACAGGDDDSLASDSALQAELELARQDSAAQPGLTDVPNQTAQNPSQPRTSNPPRTNNPPAKSTTPSTPRTTPSGNADTRTPAGTSERVAAVPAGTRLALATTSRICTNTNKVGDPFVATLSESVTAGGVTIPAGSQVRLRITQLKKSENANDQAVLAFAVEQITFNGRSFPVKASVAAAPDVEQVRTTTKGSDAKKVIGGAIVGAAVGQILGKDTKSTVIGAATGAAAGTAVAVATGDYDACIPSGGRITIALSEPLQITTAD